MGSGTAEREERNQDYDRAQDRMALLPNYYAWIHAQIRDALFGTVADLGCGAGHLLERYLPQVDRVFAVDYNEQLLRRLKLRYPTEKVVPVLADLKGGWRALEGVTADVALALDVLEHFEDQDALLAHIRELVRTGGRFVVKVPAQRRLFGPMDEASGHCRRYDPGDLTALLRRHGFSQIRQRSMNPLGALVYRWKRTGRSNFSRSVSPATLRLANRLIPAIALLDKIPGAPGLSLVGIYEKR